MKSIKDEIVSAMNKSTLGNTEKLIQILEELMIARMTGGKMPYFMTCDECGEDYLVADEFVPEPDIDYQTICQRCFNINYRATDEEKQKREAYRQASKGE